MFDLAINTQSKRTNELLNEGVELLKEDIGDENKMHIYRRLARAYHVRGEYTESLRILNDALIFELDHSNNYMKGYYFNYLALNHRKLGNNSVGMEYLLKALSAAEESGNEQLIAFCYQNLSMAYRDLRDPERTKDYIQKSIELYQSSNDLKGVARGYNNLAGLLSDQDQMEDALDSLLKARELQVQIESPYHSQIITQLNVVQILLKLERVEEAEHQIHSAETLLKLVEVPEHQLRYYFCRGEMERLRGNLDEAIRYHKLSVKGIKQGIRHKASSDSLNQLYSIYKELGDTEQALRYFEEFQEVKEKEIGAKSINSIKNLHMKKEAEDLALQLEKMKADLMETQNIHLRAMNEDLQKFVHATSHDLKEPLRNIAGFAHLIAKNNEDKLDGKSRNYLSKMVESAEQLHYIIEDISQYYRISKSELKSKEIRSEDLFNEIMKVHEDALDHNKGSILWENWPETFNGDFNKLTTLFDHLISNSLKYRSDDDPEIRIHTETRDNKLVVYFSDNGIGIDPKYADQIFQLFNRLHLSDTIKGSGVGLASVRKIVNQHGGKIAFEPNQPKGTTFYFTLPQ